MPANVISFSSKNSLPRIVYCDTNYILELISYALIDPTNLDFLACKNFYDKLMRDNVELKTSILAIDEAIYFLLATDCIEKEFEAVNKTRKDNEQKEFANLKKFIRQEPRQYKRIYCECFKRIPKFLKYLSVSGVKIVYPEDTSLKNSINEEIKDDAVEIMRKYLLSPADALHIAISLNCGIENIVTNDRDYHRVDNINVYTYLPRSRLVLTSCSQ